MDADSHALARRNPVFAAPGDQPADGRIFAGRRTLVLDSGNSCLGEIDDFNVSVHLSLLKPGQNRCQFVCRP